MKRQLITSLILILLVNQNIFAKTPTETLEIAINKLISVAADKTKSDQIKKNDLADILATEVDYNQVSKRIVSKPWRKATAEQKQQFKQQFSQILVNTYFALLKNYSNEEVLFQKEQIKKAKYAIVDTQIVSGNKKIPVRYRLIKTKDNWKIYDFVPEGISLISTYKNNYSTILKKEGMDSLLQKMITPKDDSPEG